MVAGGGFYADIEQIYRSFAYLHMCGYAPGTIELE